MNVIPFLKWAGGKRWLVGSHKDIFEIKFNNYIEPFLGSGSVFFHLLPKRAILSDKNSQLINTYMAIKLDWRAVFNELQLHSKKHCRDYYYEIRATTFDDIFRQAAQFIYLNRTCWNGLYRVNVKGQFNVPIGTKTNVILDTDNFEAIANTLQNAELHDEDFQSVIERAEPDDLVFLDPPYTVNHNNNGFIKYNKHIFSWEDQTRLHECIVNARDRGVKIILTNADHKSVRDLYESTFDIRSVPRASVLAGKSEYRGRVTELLVVG